MRVVALIAAGVALQLLGEVSGHGIVLDPKPRVYECRPEGHNKRCLVNDYANVQQLGIYPKSGPAFGNIASAGQAELRQLDEQSATRWWKNRMRPGRNTFVWSFPANHGTAGFSYYITKNGWNPDAALTATGSFEAEPFCKPAWKFDANPPHKRDGVLRHTCTVPKRSGYHVILAMWYVGRWRGWYNVIDVDFSGNGGGGGGPAVALPPGLEYYNNRKSSGSNQHTPYYGKGRAGKDEDFPGPRGPASLAAAQPRRQARPQPKEQAKPKPKPEEQAAPKPRGQRKPKGSDERKRQQQPARKRCRTTVKKWGNCHRRRKCCAKGTTCVWYNKWYSQCKPRRR